MNLIDWLIILTNKENMICLHIEKMIIFHFMKPYKSLNRFWKNISYNQVWSKIKKDSLSIKYYLKYVMHIEKFIKKIYIMDKN